MPTQEQLNRQALKTIAGLRDTVNQLWRKCCEEDGIDPDSEFVVFSESNKYVPFHNKAMQQCQEALAQYKAGGYVGLRIEGEKAK